MMAKMASNFLFFIFFVNFCNGAINRISEPTLRDRQTALAGLTYNYNGQKLVEMKQTPGFIRVGDMLLRPQDLGENPTEGFPKNVLFPSGQTWPEGVVPYMIDRSLAHIKPKILEAMAHFEKATCIKFVPITATRWERRDYVHIYSGEGCFSLVGFQGVGRHTLSLGWGCRDLGTIIHELGHAVGFWHEHQRADRDDHVTIKWNNVAWGQEYNFRKVFSSRNKFFSPYDFDSIMHYGENAFSRGWGSRGKTIISNNGKRLKEPYEKREMSKKDVKRLRTMYPCMKV